MVSVIMLSVVMVSVIMLNVAAPSGHSEKEQKGKEKLEEGIHQRDEN
jgi:hypothetical protein